MRRLALVCAVTLAVAGPGIARTYEGEEAAALRCANTLAYTGVALNAAGVMSEAEKNVLLGLSVRILERYVSGTRGQKKRALIAVRDRRDLETTLGDFRRIAAKCLAQFPTG